MNRSGFTLLELIIVIVVGGILAAVMMPRLERDPTREAAKELVRNIQYTQHLAMVDDVYDAGNSTWFSNRWKIVFAGTGYTVSSGAQEAVDPATKGKFGDLSEYTLDSLTPGGGCNSTLAFDNFGKPHTSVTALDATMTQACTIVLTGNGKTTTVAIEPQTGYVHLGAPL